MHLTEYFIVTEGEVLYFSDTTQFSLDPFNNNIFSLHVSCFDLLF